MVLSERRHIRSFAWALVVGLVVFLIPSLALGQNQAPTVDAGSNDTIRLPATASLDGTVSDDNLPNPPATYTVTWTKQSGSGTVTFGDASAVDTTAAFSESGTYVLRLTADDSALTAYDEVTITVNPMPTIAYDDASQSISEDGVSTTIVARLNAAPDVAVTLPFTVSGTATNPDDYTKNRSSPITFPIGVTTGTTTITIVNDSESEGDETVIFTMGTPTNATLGAITVHTLTILDDENAAPTVDAGSNAVITWPTDETNLDGTVSDDDLPDPPATYTVTWTKQSGPGTVTFTNANAVDTTAEFSASGTYVLCLTADDSDETAYDEVTIEVNVAPTVEAGSNTVITWPTDETNLDGTVSDDSLPSSPGTYTVTWTKQSGPGTVTFTNANAVDTTAEFSASGSYVLRLTAGDGNTTAYDEVTIEVNAAPTVEAGSNTVITWPTDETNLDGTVSDDSLPSSPGTYTVTWTKQSGPGTVTFTNANAVDTTAEFSTSGTYVLRLTADDSDETAYDEVTIEVNVAPSVDAGSNAVITWPTDETNLDGTVSDDNLPSSPGTYTVLWTKQSGPGTVTFTNANAVDTTAEFSASGSYVLRLSADDSDTTAYDEVTIEVNAAPTVNAGLDDEITLPSSATLDATVSDDGLPSSPGTYTVTWTKTSGSGTVTFGNSSAVDTTAAFSEADTYVLRLTAGDGDTTAFDEVEITVDSANAAPTVDAGTDQTVGLSVGATLNATVSDDGLPATPGTYTVTWTMQSGSGTVTFGNSSLEDTTVSFSATGTYVLRLTADDGDETAYDDVQITVVSLPVANYSVASQSIDEDGVSTTIVAQLSIAPQAEVSLPFTVSGTAVNPDDYTKNRSSPITFPIGVTSGTTTIYIVDDATSESNETVIFTMGTPTNAILGSITEHTLTIIDDDGGSNQAPTVDAGSNTVITWPTDQTNLDGTVSDDGLPSTPGTYTVTWTMQSGSGTVTFTNANAVDTTAEFSASGSYVLRLTADDGDETAYDEVTIEVNAAPTVNAGLDDTITLPSSATLDATVSDDGLPSSPGTYTVTWTKTSGSGTVTFGNSSAVDTTAAFSASDTYVLRLTVGDGDTTAYDEVQITVNSSSANSAPTVDAGIDQTVGISSGASLDATVSDDGLPATPGTYTVTWTKTSGSGTVTFGNSSAVDTTAAFSASGTYVLRLTADDGDETAYDEVQITVTTGSNTPPVVDAGLDDAVNLSSAATLDATVTDDGLPATPGTYTVTWTKQSGPGTVTFGNSSAVDTTAAFDTVGTYVLRLTADDDDVTAYDELTVVVVSDDTFILPCKIEIEDYRDGGEGVGYHDTYGLPDLTACDDVGGGYCLYVISAGEWVAYDVYVPETTLYTFTLRINYIASNVLQVLFDDELVTEITGYDTDEEWGQVTVRSVPLTAGLHVMKLYTPIGWNVDYINYLDVGGTTPVDVDAGPDQTVTLPAIATLDATASDDGLPNPPGTFTTRWTMVSSPTYGTACFDDHRAIDTTVVFDTAGVYVLRLSADDGDSCNYDEVQITVNDVTSRVTLPGRLEAEDYSDQGEGISYHDTTSGNAGSVYRSDDVDIESCSDTGGGYDVYTIAADEWLAFDVAVSADTAYYDIVARVSSTTSSRQMHVEVDDVDVTGAMTFDSTGGWTDVTVEGIHLTAGRHTVKVVMDTGDFKLNYVDILAETYEEYIVEDGVANADIVISSDPLRSVALAADELQDIIYDITGATLPIVTTETAADVHIYVGQSSYTDTLGISTVGLTNDGFKIVSGSDWLALIGADTDYVAIQPWQLTTANYELWDEITGSTYVIPPIADSFQIYNYGLDIWLSDGMGSLQAVYEFCRDLGCRWYYPGDIGQVLPDTDDIGLPATNRTVQADFPLRQFAMARTTLLQSDADEVKWQLRLGHRCGNDSEGFVNIHGMLYVHGREEMKTAHPEYYQLIDGERVLTGWAGGGNPCLSSTGFFAENVNFVQKVYDHYGEPMVSVTPPDGYGEPHCECELCAGKDTPERGTMGFASDYVHGYSNDVAEEVYLTHPDKKINIAAYGYYYLAPLDLEEFSPNVVVKVCDLENNLLGEGATRSYEDYLKMTDEWLALLPSSQSVIIRGYYIRCDTDPGNPRYYLTLIKDRLRRWKDGTALGSYIENGRTHETEGVPDTAWDAIAACHLNMYATIRLHWDADLDFDAMLDEYYEKFYGPAADEMKAFVEYAQANFPDFHTDSNILTTERSLLDDAIDAAEGSGVYANRVAIMDRYLQTAENEAPVVSAGDDDEITLPANATLDGTVSDDGLPDDPSTYTVLWTIQSGPGTVTFGDEDAVDTTAAFDTVGTYVLRLTADDTYDDTYDDVTITVDD